MTENNLPLGAPKRPPIRASGTLPAPVLSPIPDSPSVIPPPVSPQPNSRWEPPNPSQRVQYPLQTSSNPPTPSVSSQTPFPYPPTSSSPASLPQKRSYTVPQILAVALISGLLGGMIGNLLDTGDNAINNPVSVSPSSQPVDTNITNLPPLTNASVVEIAERVTPSVVRIDLEDQSASGSGFIIDQEGHIVTNAHVTQGTGVGNKIFVLLHTGDTVEGKLVGESVDYDIAVVKIDPPSLPNTQWGDSNSIKVGEGVIALGSPLGLEGTVTSGIVSSLNRPVTAGGTSEDDGLSFINAVQTDAAINPGNSGGPLVNGRGEVIGVNSAIATLPSSYGSSSGSIGLGFAIPSNTAKRVGEDIIAKGESKTPAIGVTLDLSYDGEGAKIGEVNAGSPAASAGLKKGDIIQKINGRRIYDATSLIVTIRDNPVGTSVPVEVLRSGGSQIFTVILGEVQE